MNCMIATYIAGVAFFCACAERSVREGVGGPELVAEGGAASGLVPQRHRDLLQHDAVLALCTRLMLGLPSVHQFFHERIRLLSKHVGSATNTRAEHRNNPLPVFTNWCQGENLQI
jgi:hypothetical protein